MTGARVVWVALTWFHDLGPVNWAGLDATGAV